MSGRRVVLDASALVAWVMKERGYDTVDRILAVGVAPSSVVVETLYRAVERGHRLPRGELHAALLEMGLAVGPVTDEDAVRAAGPVASSRRAGGDRSLSLGDGLCLAVAERLGLTVTGGDQHWETLDLPVAYVPCR